jgi:hypothetical protein
MLTSEFIEKANKIHNNKYTYYISKDKVVKRDKIEIEYNGQKFYQLSCSHLSGHNPEINAKYSSEQFIQKSKELYMNKYIYDKTVYINNNTKLIITCPTHGDFETVPRQHLFYKKGCDKCKNQIDKINIFVNSANEIHNNKYIYDNIIFNKKTDKIKITCKEHGIFEQSVSSHLKGIGCSSCSNNKKINYNEFIKRSIKIHGNKFEYDKESFISYRKSINIYCKDHGWFKQIPYDHVLSKFACHGCRESYGEIVLSNILDTYNINYIRQYKFDNCINKRKLPFDFYLPDNNICIEFQGMQHFIPVKHFGGIEKFKKQVINDNIKKEYCEYNNIKLIIIRYDDIDIQKIIEKIL